MNAEPGSRSLGSDPARELDLIEIQMKRRHAEWRRTGLHRDLNVVEALHEGLERRATDRIRFLSSGHQADLSIAEIFEEGSRLATALVAAGVRPGGRLALQIPNWPEALTLFYAGLLLRAVIVPVPTIYGPTDVAFILDDAKVDTFVMVDRWGSHNYLDGISTVSRA